MTATGAAQGAGGVAALARAVAGRLAAAGYDRQAAALRALAGRAPAAVPVPGPGATAPPVVTHLPAALRAAGDDATAELLQAVALAAAWTRTASYLRAPPSPGFGDRYAHATLLGPPDGERVDGDGDGERDRAADEVALGLLLLAPATHYPPHRHPADEVYLPAATARWLEPDGAYATVPAGAVRHHRSWLPHAVRTGAGPLLAVYVWTGDVRTPSQFCPPV